MAQAGEGENVIPDTADHVFRLPYTAARDARPCVQRVQPAHANELGPHCPLLPGLLCLSVLFLALRYE